MFVKLTDGAGKIAEDKLIVTSFKHDVHTKFLRYRIEGDTADTCLNIDYVFSYTVEPITDV
jgi:hypothetical protein